MTALCKHTRQLQATEHRGVTNLLLGISAAQSCIAAHLVLALYRVKMEGLLGRQTGDVQRPHTGIQRLKQVRSCNTYSHIVTPAATLACSSTVIPTPTPTHHIKHQTCVSSQLEICQKSSIASITAPCHKWSSPAPAHSFSRIATLLTFRLQYR